MYVHVMQCSQVDQLVGQFLLKINNINININSLYGLHFLAAAKFAMDPASREAMVTLDGAYKSQQITSHTKAQLLAQGMTVMPSGLLSYKAYWH